MLTANVGFLAIPGVIVSTINGDISGPRDVRIFTSPSQIASCISVEASVGSIVISLLLARHNRTKQKVDPAGAASDQLYAALCSRPTNCTSAVGLPLPEYLPSIWPGTDGYYLQSPVGTADVGVGRFRVIF